MIDMNELMRVKIIIELLLSYAQPSMNPDDYTDLEELLGKLHKHYLKSDEAK